jgi:hypothetical protein
LKNNFRKHQQLVANTVVFSGSESIGFWVHWSKF